MRLITKLIIVLILFVGINAKFSQKPDYSFLVVDPNDDINTFVIELSADEQKFALMVYDRMVFEQTIFDFDGNTLCSVEYPFIYGYLSWPSKTTGTYIDIYNRCILKSTQLCGKRQFLFYLHEIWRDYSFVYNESNSWGVFGFKNNEVIQFDIETGEILRFFQFDNETEQITKVNYSPDHKYLFCAAESQDKNKVIIFDTELGVRLKQIQTELKFMQGNPNGDGFIGNDTKSGIIYIVDQYGNKKQIWPQQKLLQNPMVNETIIKICTDDNKLIALRITEQDENKKYEIISYNSNDGSQSQTIQIDFIPNLKQYDCFMCNKKYLSIFDINGKVNIFKYTHQQSPKPSNDQVLLWPKILFLILSVLTIASIIAFIISKRKQKVKKSTLFNKEQEMSGSVL